MNVAIQISPQSKSAYFQSYIDVAQQELAYICKDVSFEYACIGTLEFLFADVEEARLSELVHLSFVQGLYAQDGRCLIPLDVLPKYSLHEDFVFGSKYRGKTNETLLKFNAKVNVKSMQHE